MCPAGFVCRAAAARSGAAYRRATIYCIALVNVHASWTSMAMVSSINSIKRMSESSCARHCHFDAPCFQHTPHVPAQYLSPFLLGEDPFRPGRQEQLDGLHPAVVRVLEPSLRQKPLAPHVPMHQAQQPHIIYFRRQVLRRWSLHEHLGNAAVVVVLRSDELSHLAGTAETPRHPRQKAPNVSASHKRAATRRTAYDPFA